MDLKRRHKLSVTMGTRKATTFQGSSQDIPYYIYIKMFKATNGEEWTNTDEGKDFYLLIRRSDLIYNHKLPLNIWLCIPNRFTFEHFFLNLYVPSKYIYIIPPKCWCYIFPFVSVASSWLMSN